MKPFSPHERFFSSLNRLENRLASETKPNPTPPPQPLASSDPLDSPLYLRQSNPHSATPVPPNLQDSSVPPLEFLSTTTQPHPSPPTPPDDIERLMGLLGLSDEGDGGSLGSSCGCSGGGFYSKIVGVKGPRCGREMRRIDGWIDYYRGEGDGREPARLAHLLLAKAACKADDGEVDGFAEIGFPAAVEEFFHHDPSEIKSL